MPRMRGTHWVVVRMDDTSLNAMDCTYDDEDAMDDDEGAAD